MYEKGEGYFKVVINREINEFDLLYDIVLTNKKGEKLYKKVIFNVSDDNPQNILKVRYKIDLSR